MFVEIAMHQYVFFHWDHPVGPAPATPVIFPNRLQTRPTSGRLPSFKVSRLDNFHSVSGEEAAEIVGEFLFPGVALWVAMTIVNESLSYLLAQRLCRGKLRTTAAELVADWYDFGDSAFIRTLSGEPRVRFNSLGYAKDAAVMLCGARS
ncbi:MAG: hypothetical protein ABI619_05335 [Betaproteobacteria bacterium]